MKLLIAAVAFLASIAAAHAAPATSSGYSPRPCTNGVCTCRAGTTDCIHMGTYDCRGAPIICDYRAGVCSCTRGKVTSGIPNPTSGGATTAPPDASTQPVANKKKKPRPRPRPPVEKIKPDPPFTYR